MHFSALPQSSHPAVVLRPISGQDLDVWYGYLTMPLAYQYTSWDLQSADELAGYVLGAELMTPLSRLRLAIALRSTGALVGTAGFHTVSAENRSAEIAYDLAPSVWGQGIASHVCNVLTAWAHAHVGLVRVQATVLDANVRSARVVERCGYVREGLLRSYRHIRGRPGDFLMYAHVEPGTEHRAGHAEAP
jgi:ribosomal-protein-alanine N-acetyltransferase